MDKGVGVGDGVLVGTWVGDESWAGVGIGVRVGAGSGVGLGVGASVCLVVGTVPDESVLVGSEGLEYPTTTAPESTEEAVIDAVSATARA